MRAVLRVRGGRATIVAVQPDSESCPHPQETQSSAQTGSEAENQWFPSAARALLGSDPGLALSLLTGVPDRTCYRYTSGERAPTAFVITQLLRSEHGWQWLAAAMDGSGVPWWCDIQRARSIVAQLDAISEIKRE